MRFLISASVSALLFATSVLSQATFSRSSKRGLVFVPNTAFPQDDQIWVNPSSDITWYYNYKSTPPYQFSNIDQSKLEFVPMLWGTPSDDSFVTNVTALIKGGRNITHVLAFNEPDMRHSWGGSDMSVEAAIQGWKDQIEPLQKLGIKAGAPAIAYNWTWFDEFALGCTNCTFDFIPVHSYGNFGALQYQISQAHSAYPTTEIWVTEYAYDRVSLQQCEEYFNVSAKFLDGADYIERYSYFGAFRSSESRIGPNLAMLTKDGKLTNIGSWYLGGSATNNIPSAASLTYAMGFESVFLGSLMVGWIGMSFL